ncbi:BBP7 family outer membrane beta-barrel protein [Allorhodopirellula heiligendammensis]|uniref:Uncharacterized protein n=1 Tax=Allorhodopirellula heiligendammensis TaxID=2714739 RepID=A0A5C6C0Y5_9BACT|nr:BBP7 family outer membrane beta-barrel protein [Allorhodopirellula heiligendammensis]TWU16509.1 hypothetical protein Poly21_37140 [Allorhodopirellula heiligendammensis]
MSRLLQVLVKSITVCLFATMWHAGAAAQAPSTDPYSTGGYPAGTTNVFTAPPMWIGSPSGAGYPSSFGSAIGGPPSDRLWFRGEYLYWRTKGMDTPALATTSPTGTPQDEAGILGFDSTSVLFGGGSINGSATNGLRLKGGFYFTPSAAFGIEGEYFSLADQNDGFSGGSDYDILARPFFDTTNDRETAQLINYPNVFEGDLAITSSTGLRSAMLAGRAALCPTCGGNCVSCRNSDRVDWIVGYRNMRLEDQLVISESAESFVPGALGTIQLSDQFNTKNEFNGLQLGVAYQANMKRVWLESLLRVAVGQNKQSVGIAGSTALTEFGTTTNYPGGLLAQRFNSGTFERNQFTMIPEIGLTLGVRIFDCLHATAGYTVVYLPGVVRAGDQIDTDVNPNLLAPPVDPLTGSHRPQFKFVESDYYAHGLSLGMQLQF